MKKINLFILFLLCLIIITDSESVFAFGWARTLPPKHEVIMVRGDRFHFHGGRFYRPAPFGFFVVPPPMGAFVTFVPMGHRIVMVGGINYYFYEGIYYQPVPSGYVVVPAPVETSTTVLYSPEPKTEGASADTIIINVPNSNGSYTPVALIKQKNGYIGPQGEYYPGHPTMEQLKALYGM